MIPSERARGGRGAGGKEKKMNENPRERSTTFICNGASIALPLEIETIYSFNLNSSSTFSLQAISVVIEECLNHGTIGCWHHLCSWFLRKKIARKYGITSEKENYQSNYGVSLSVDEKEWGGGSCYRSC